MFYLSGLYIYTQEEESPGVTTVACDQASWSIALALAAIKPKASNISPRASYAAAGLSKGGNLKKMQNGRVYQHGWEVDQEQLGLDYHGLSTISWHMQVTQQKPGLKQQKKNAVNQKSG